MGLRLHVCHADLQCGFEGEDTCGWANADTEGLQWKRVESQDTVDRESGPRYDDTYGPSKHVGKSEAFQSLFFLRVPSNTTHIVI